MEICKLEHIHKDYRMGEIVTPLKDITLSVNEGEFIAVEGPSGIGKSTLLYVMGTLLQSDGGTYTFGGKDVSAFNDAQKSEFRAKQIGFLFQDSTMIQALTLRENLLFTQGVCGKKDPKKVDELLYQFGLEDRAHFFPHQLSGGQRRRAMAARALIHNPKLILADEPTGALDSKTSQEIIDIFHELHRQGNTIVLITHDNDVAKQAERAIHIFDGRIREVTL